MKIHEFLYGLQTLVAALPWGLRLQSEVGTVFLEPEKRPKPVPLAHSWRSHPGKVLLCTHGTEILGGGGHILILEG